MQEKTRFVTTLSILRNPFPAKNHTLRSFRYIIYFAYKVGIISAYSNLPQYISK